MAGSSTHTPVIARNLAPQVNFFLLFSFYTKSVTNTADPTSWLPNPFCSLQTHSHQFMSNNLNLHRKSCTDSSLVNQTHVCLLQKCDWTSIRENALYAMSAVGLPALCPSQNQMPIYSHNSRTLSCPHSLQLFLFHLEAHLHWTTCPSLCHTLRASTCSRCPSVSSSHAPERPHPPFPEPF